MHQHPATTPAIVPGPSQAAATMGALHRAIRLRARPGQIRAVVEDDVHHFRVQLDHDGARVTHVASEAPRTPYTLCGRAGDELAALVGTPLIDNLGALLHMTDARLQCTHQHDLAALAIAAAARGTAALAYDITVSDPVNGTQQAFLRRDDAPVLHWLVRGNVIIDPEPYAGVALGAGFSQWVEQHLAAAPAEAALVLRRGVFISGVRRLPPDGTMVRLPRASGLCWVQQPQRVAESVGNRPFRTDFSGRSEHLTGADQEWLEG